MSWNLKDLEQHFLIGSTLVEGSTLTEDEAKDVLAGRTVQGHPVSEIRELENYRLAVQWLMDELAKSPYLSIDLIKAFHFRLFDGFNHERAGQWKISRNYTYLADGVRIDFTDPAQVPAEMDRWVEQFNRFLDRTGHADDFDPVEQAAYLYYRFEKIHPFHDGNGRMGRILMAYWFHQVADLSWHFYYEDKLEHLKALEAANQGDFQSLIQFFKKRVKKENKG